MAPAAAAVEVAVGKGSTPCDKWIAEVLGATSSVPVAELSVEMVCVPLRLAETDLRDVEMVSTGCVDDGDVCAGVDVASARSVLRQLIWIIGANSVMVVMSFDFDPSDMVRTPVLALPPRSGQLSVETVPVETTWEQVWPPLFPQV